VSESVLKSWHGLSFFLCPCVLGHIGVASIGLMGDLISNSSGSDSDGLGGHKKLVLSVGSSSGMRGIVVFLTTFPWQLVDL